MTTTAELREIEKGEGPFYVENIGVTQFSFRDNVAKTDISLELGPKGTNESVSVVPKEAFLSQGFRRAIIGGYLSISTAGSAIDRLSQQLEDNAAVEAERRRKLLAGMDESNAVKDLVPDVCLETGCGNPTALTAAEKATGTPSLCGLHQNKTMDYISTQTGPNEWKFTKKNVGIETIVV